MARIGLLTFSDGRDFVHQDLLTFLAEKEQQVVGALMARGHEVVCGQEPIWTNELVHRHRGLHPDLVDHVVRRSAIWHTPRGAGR